MTNKQPSVETTPEKSVDEIAENFVQKFLSHTKDRTRAYLDNHNNRDGYDWFKGEVADLLKAERQKREEVVEEEIKQAHSLTHKGESEDYSRGFEDACSYLWVKLIQPNNTK